MNNNYINDYLMKNNVIDTCTEETVYSVTEKPKIQTGGNKTNNKPTGGFPPIISCNLDVDKPKKRKRAITYAPNVVSLKNILSDGKKEPFL